MRFVIELAGVPLGYADLEPRARAVGVFVPGDAYFAVRAVFREGGNAFWDLLNRPRRSARGRRWRARLVARMHRWSRALALRTEAGDGIATVRVFIFDTARLEGPLIVVAHFGEAIAGVPARVVVPPGGEATSSAA